MSRTTKQRPGIREIAPGRFLIQVSVNSVRRTARVTGTVADAKAKLAELAGDAREPQTRVRPDSPTTSRASAGPSNVPTLKTWLYGRYAERCKIVQQASTAKVNESQRNYLIYFLGDRRLDEIGIAEINWYVEQRAKTGPISFRLKKDGTACRARGETLSNVAINKSLSLLRASLNLAHEEGVIANKVKVQLLPEDDATPIVPPSDDVLERILVEAGQDAIRQVAPFMVEVIHLSVETGLRPAELMHITWRSIDWTLGPNREGALRVEEQGRGRIVGGKRWVPKNRRHRLVPLSALARELLLALQKQALAEGRARPEDLVIPNVDGTPYTRLQSAEKNAGGNTWRVMKEAMGHDVTLYDLRHVFAVRRLQAGVPMATVSQWLGHSDINLTVKRYGRFAAENHDQWRWMTASSRSVAEIVSSRPRLQAVAADSKANSVG